MQGKRQDITDEHPLLLPGEYGKHPRNGNWYACSPVGSQANLSGHEVTEYEDGTITVSPSILIESHRGTWHGYLERGVWREV